HLCIDDPERSQKKHFLDVINLTYKRHTTDNIFSAIKYLLRSKNFGFDQICAVVTDSPFNMAELWVIYQYL
ncbi:hypothetical protein VP01_1309g4, partial [Puccinia sorghi]